MQVQTEATLTFGHTQESWSLVGKWGATDQAAVLDMLGERTGCPSPFCDFLSFLSIMFQALHSFLLSLVYCFECPEGCVFAQGPKSSFLLEVGPCLWGWGAGGGDGLVDAASHKSWILTGMDRLRVHTPNEVAAHQPFSWHSDSSALILI